MHPRPPGPIRWERHTFPSGGSRWLARLDPRDDRRYRALVAPLVPRIERSLGPGVFAHRATVDGRVRPWPGARAAWRRAIRSAVASRPRAAVIVSDVRDCYGSIADPASDAAGCGDELAAFLRDLHDAGVRGLPVGPDPSALIANGVLARADREAAAAGCQLIRWVDDVVLVAAGRRPVVRAFDAWRRGLAEVGLEAHEGKTRLFIDAGEALSVIGLLRPSDLRPEGRDIIRSR